MFKILRDLILDILFQRSVGFFHVFRTPTVINQKFVWFFRFFVFYMGTASRYAFLDFTLILPGDQELVLSVTSGKIDLLISQPLAVELPTE